MTASVIRVNDEGRYQVGLTRDGIDFAPVRDSFAMPRPAIDFANALDDRASRPVNHPDLARALEDPDRRGAAGSPAEAPVLTQDASSVCAGCGAPTRPGRHGQRRLTCSDRCRRAVARRAAANASGADTDGARSFVTPSRPAAG